MYIKHRTSVSIMHDTLTNLHAAVVNNDAVELNLRVQLGHLLAAFQKQPVGKLPAQSHNTP